MSRTRTKAKANLAGRFLYKNATVEFSDDQARIIDSKTGIHFDTLFLDDIVQDWLDDAQKRYPKGITSVVPLDNDEDPEEGCGETDCYAEHVVEGEGPE